jgi:AraC-like DNA-binding protein
MRPSRKLYFLFCCLWCFGNFAFCQKKGFQSPDSLKGKTYSYLYNQYVKDVGDTISSVLYLSTYFDKATIENDTINKAIALNELSYYTSTQEEKLDLINRSLLETNSVDSLFSVATYNNLGLYYQDHYDYDNALKQYLIVMRLAKNGNDKKYESIAINNIAWLKTDIGKHEEALEMHRKCFNLEMKMQPQEEYRIITSSLGLAKSLRNNKKYDSASYYYHSIIDKVEKRHSYFLSIAKIDEGVNLYYKKEYEQAKILLEEGASLINTSSLYYLKYYIVSQFYLGEIYQFSDTEIAVKHFLKVDSLLTQKDIVIPEVRGAYVSLIANYGKEDNYEEQLRIINKVIKFDSINSSRKISIGGKLKSEFDTPQLLKSKEIAIKKLENRNENLSLKVALLLILFLLVSVLFFFQFRRHKIYKKRFETIIKELNNKTTNVKKPDVLKTSQNLSVDSKIVTVVLDKLSVFESKKGFLKNTITVTSLARKLSTNTKYLSKIINTYKGKTFIHYINDLRVEYILNELKVNTTLHRYTILGIAKEASFNSAESFTTAFKKKTGITPSYYIKNLKKSKK